MIDYQVIVTDSNIPEGRAGCMLGGIIYIRPSHKDDAGLLAHEQKHVDQWRAEPLTFHTRYDNDDSFRLQCEVEAYAAQSLCYKDNRAWKLAGFISSLYNLNVTQIQAFWLICAERAKQKGGSSMGWKTYAGAAIVAVGGALEAIAQAYPEYEFLGVISKVILAAGASLGLVGVRHAISKTSIGTNP